LVIIALTVVSNRFFLRSEALQLLPVELDLLYGRRDFRAYPVFLSEADDAEGGADGQVRRFNGEER
jgi:hypothetical protein